MRLLLAASSVLVALLATPSSAAADDSYPCGSQVSASWSTEPVQPCPLTSPTGAGEGFPLYLQPVANPSGATPPAPAGWLYGTANKYFVCQQQFPSAVFYHPTAGWFNYWWAFTRTTSGIWGWVPEVFFKGGNSDESDYGLRGCPPPAAPPPPPPPAPPPPPPPPPPIPPGPCSRAPVSSAEKIHLAFANHRRVTTVPFDSRPLVKGTIVSGNGAPLGDSELCVGIQRGAAGKVKAIGSVRSNDDGRFRFRLGRGVSRRIWFVHRDGVGAAVAGLRVRVRAPVALGASADTLRNGQTVRLNGRMLVAPRAALLVEMQALRGHHWQTFATTKTKRGGRFRYRYRFTRTYSFQTYMLRARIERQDGSPFATGASKPVAVGVRG
jgi:hypothetical protein